MEQALRYTATAPEVLLGFLTSYNLRRVILQRSQVCNPCLATRGLLKSHLLSRPSKAILATVKPHLAQLG